MNGAGQVSGVASVGSASPVLVARGIDKAYETFRGKLEVLKGLDLDVMGGTIVAILGASGSGKSTLLNILGTLDRPDAGMVEIRGWRVDPLRDDQLASFRARRLGFVFQFHHLLPEFSAEENVMLPLLIAGEGAGPARERAQAALTDVGLAERWDHRPAQLSGGRWWPVRSWCWRTSPRATWISARRRSCTSSSHRWPADGGRRLSW
jgi:lipoprotein-releasing system ATP-binding protein